MKERVKSFLGHTRQALAVSLVLMLICGLLFPALLSGLSALFFPHQAGGSLIEVNGRAVAAKNVGQEFLQDYYLWSRPSAYHYNVYVEGADGKKTYPDGSAFPGIGSGSNNYAPTNPDLTARVEAAIADFLKKNPDVKREDIPTDLLTASGSGLDPHISPASAGHSGSPHGPSLRSERGGDPDHYRRAHQRKIVRRFRRGNGERGGGSTLAVGMAMGLIKAEA